ncbi:MAG: TonB-dependent receptor [Gammaproteobacteria bacterium]|nr:TonB-dependent receptor [Gammaproteobacteria bacterium]
MGALPAAVLLLLSNPILAQDADQAAEDLGAITVTSPRVEKSLNEVPGAISKVGKDDIQLGQQQLTIDEALKEVPGVFVLNSYNYAQDSRIMIRGFGARADFGIRSIKLYVDGIPSTTPDGQGGVDGIDFGSAASIEVIRGPASSLYGAAAGGVISITTEDGPPVPYAEARYTVGEYDFDKTQLKFGGDNGPLNYTFSASRLHFEGYRDHSKAENVKFNSKVRYDFDSTSSLTAVMNIIDMPIQDDPGALLLSEVAADRRQARARNLQFDGGESVEQQKLGFVYRNEIAPGHEIQLRNYYVMRNLDNKLPFGSPVFPFEPGGQIDLDRFFFGGGAQYTFTGDINQFTLGFDVDQQTDDRKEFDNLNGAKGPLSLNQEEDVNSIGIFAFNEQYLTDTLTLSGGIRYDRVRFKVTDKFFNDSAIGFPPQPDTVLDDSGVIEFEELSPMVGLLWSPHRSINLYSNVSTSFETPTTTEFANPAGGGAAGGFNQNLESQTATNYEVGMKGIVPEWWSLTYNAAVFHIDVKNELVGIELANNREVFRMLHHQIAMDSNLA